jgi:hypothetical protein
MDEFMAATDGVSNLLYRIEKRREALEVKDGKAKKLKEAYPCNLRCSPCNNHCRGVNLLPRRCGSGGWTPRRASGAKGRGGRQSPSSSAY